MNKTCARAQAPVMVVKSSGAAHMPIIESLTWLRSSSSQSEEFYLLAMAAATIISGRICLRVETVVCKNNKGYWCVFAYKNIERKSFVKVLITVMATCTAGAAVQE